MISGSYIKSVAMKFFPFLLVTFMPLLALSQDKVIKDDNAEQRAVVSFHSIEVSNAFDLYLNQSDNETVVVSAGKLRDRDQIVTEVVDGVLKIRFGKDSRGWWRNVGN